MSLKLISHKLFPPIIFAIIIALLWHPVLSVGFLSDDFEFLRLAQVNRDWAAYFSHNIIGTQEGNSYGPMWNILFRIQYDLFGLKAASFHAVSLFLYWLSSLVLYAFTHALTKRKDIAFTAAIFFLLFPGHSEAVSWVAVQVHLFAALCFMIALWMYTRYLQSGRSYYYFAAFLSIGLSLLTKEIGISFIALFFLLELYCYQKGWIVKAVLRFLFFMLLRFAPFILLMAIYLMLRQDATGQLASYYGGGIHIDLMHWMQQMVELTLAIFLSVEARVAAMQWIEANWIIALSIDALVGLVLLLTLKDQRKFFIWTIASFVLVSLPFLQTYISRVHTEGERYAYLMSFFFAMMLALIFVSIYRGFHRAYITKRWQAFALMAVVIAVVFTPLTETTHARINNWHAAGILTDSILESGKDLVLNEHDHYVIIALPEMINGAQVLRNAIGEAMKNFSDQDDFSFERMMNYTTLYPDEIDQELLMVKQISEDRFRIETDTRERLFSGEDLHVGEYVTVFLEDFGKGTDYLGNAIDIEIQEEAFDIFSDPGRSLKMLYVDGGVMKEWVLIE